MKQKELKIRKSEEKSALILISGSAGELDWILPILDHLLRNRFRLQVLFLTRHARKSVKENYTLEDFLVGRSNGVVVTSVGGAVFEYLERSSYLVHRARLKLRADKNQF